MSKEIMNASTNDAVGELEQQVSISVLEHNVSGFLYRQKAHVGEGRCTDYFILET